MRVTIAGATGFVGRHLVERLRGECELVGLSRSHRPRGDGIDFRACDLFSLRETEEALEGADVAVYLVHSMLPQARLTQGSFADLDLFLADNFARAARTAGVRRIVYLGGIVPEGETDLSPHLESRLEVERVLASHSVPVVALRAGLVVGPGGSSFDMMERLVQRLPVMICPRWTRTMAQPVALRDVVELLARSILDDDLPAGAYDAGGPDRVTWVDLMGLTARELGLRRRFLPVSFFSVHLSLLWLRLVTGAPRQLAAPLVESLRHPMLAHDHRLFERYRLTPTPIAEALDDAVRAERAAHDSRGSRLSEMRRSARSPGPSRVCSVQRMRLAHDEGAAEVARRYAQWIVVFLRPWLRVTALTDGSLDIGLVRPFGPPLSMLELTRNTERSDDGRELFHITGGALAARVDPPGRFEFRRLHTGPEVLAAVHAFVPALPWPIYRVTQAPFHLWVMHAFGRKLAES